MERELRWNDFEDCVQFVAARGLDADYIVTRDVDGFDGSEITPVTPDTIPRTLRSWREEPRT
jgi:predicted nucleic acid-binding protein